MAKRPTWFDVLRTTASGMLFGGVLDGAVFGSAAELHGLVVGGIVAAVFMIEARLEPKDQHLIDRGRSE